VPELEGWQISPYYRPVREVGGDFYDFHFLRNGRLGLLVWDATGKSLQRFPNAIATMFFFVTEERAAAGRMVREVLSPTLKRPENRWRLALPERERFGLVYRREPVRHRRDDTICTTRALPPLPLQHLGQRLAVEVPYLLVRKLADGEIYFLLAGTWLTKGYTQDLHLCATGTRILRVDAYLATSRLHHRLGQGTPCSTALRPPP